MINITLTSDYGLASHYAASIKGNLYNQVTNIRVIDITHQIDNFNLLQAAYVLKSVYKNFAEGTIHLVCIDANLLKYEHIIIAKHHQQYFIVLDNGIINLLFNEDEVVEIWVVKNEFFKTNNLFIENAIFPQIVKHIASNLPLIEIAQLGQLKQQLIHNKIETDTHGFTGFVVFVDGFGNAITNVNKTLFEKTRQGRPFKIHYARKEYFSKIANHYHEVKAGTEIILYNSDGFFEIAINQGNASQLLGLKVGSKIIIEFL